MQTEFCQSSNLCYIQSSADNNDRAADRADSTRSSKQQQSIRHSTDTGIQTVMVLVLKIRNCHNWM